MKSEFNIAGVWIFLFASSFSPVFSAPLSVYKKLPEKNLPYLEILTGEGSRSSVLNDLNKRLYSSMLNGDTSSSGLIIDSILNIISAGHSDSLSVSDSYYYLGVSNLLSGRNKESSGYFILSSEFREKLGIYDSLYANSQYNLGYIQSIFGDYKKMEKYTLRSVEVDKTIYGESSPKLVLGYSSLVTAYLGLKEYDRAIEYGRAALKIIESHNRRFDSDLADLYTNLGVCYIRVSDYSKAVLYLESAESVYEKFNLVKGERYLNILNSLAAAYFFLGQLENSDNYYLKGLKIAESLNTFLSQNFVNSFAKIVGNSGNIKKGEAMMENSLLKAEKHYGTDSGIYISVLINYADYLREYEIDINRSLALYRKCLSYLELHKEDILLKSRILLGYAQSLKEGGEPEKALAVIQDLIYEGTQSKSALSGMGNPEFQSIEPDQWSLKLFKVKYGILNDLYERTSEKEYILAASATSQLIVNLLEKVRINIDEEDSRLVLGDRYRDFYITAIRDCDICYKLTGREEYFEKAFELSERSKAAALLASTRELKATQFSIPGEVAELEKQLQVEISYYNAMISDEVTKDNPDSGNLSEWKKIIFTATQNRDSLIDLFEKKYPGYFLMKYNTSVIDPSDIAAFAGRNTTYISYVVGNEIIYIFIINRKNRIMISTEIDSSFFDKIMAFRDLLKAPSLNSNAKADFLNYQKLGAFISDKIFSPVKKYLISDKLLISPDNILSYIPLEVLPESELKSDGISYKSLSYLTKKYRISYTYSATFLAESSKPGVSNSENLVAFAPFYTDKLEVDSLLSSRQQRYSRLSDLPFARSEAEFVSSLFKGRLYLNDAARESVFKEKAGEFDIIHLAMHTILNDSNPMQSKMIFSQSGDPGEDGMLNTYEIYGIHLKAKMVVLSSCNTGSGTLHSGEGILSLSRGFMYSGGQSVVMSLWEIEDKAGTEIIKDFYKFLKKGYNKSESLRRARLKFLKNSDMMKSHPYFWSALVIYGKNDRLYPSQAIRFTAASCIVILLLGIVLLYRKLR